MHVCSWLHLNDKCYTHTLRRQEWSHQNYRPQRINMIIPVHVTPSPSNIVWHSQLKIPPGKLIHLAKLEQLWVPSLHLSMSACVWDNKGLFYKEVSDIVYPIPLIPACTMTYQIQRMHKLNHDLYPNLHVFLITLLHLDLQYLCTIKTMVARWLQTSNIIIIVHVVIWH